MDTERLEKMEGVLMDYAVGETSAEVSAVVEALMELEEMVRGRVEEWRVVVGRARGAMEGKVEEELPRFDIRKMERTKLRARIGRGILWGAGMAACVGVGVWLGSERMTKDVLVKAPGRVAVKAAPEVASVGDFWSVARLRAYAAAARKPQQAGVSWRERVRSSDIFGGGL